MQHLLALTIGDQPINAPKTIPTGGMTTAQEIVRNGIGIVFVLAIVAAVILLAWAGIMWASSQGDKQKVTNARRMIVFTIIGLVLILSSFMIINLIGNIAGVQLLWNGSTYYPNCNQGQDC